jgi:hypothetical protein
MKGVIRSVMRNVTRNAIRNVLKNASRNGLVWTPKNGIAREAGILNAPSAKEFHARNATVKPGDPDPVQTNAAS